MARKKYSNTGSVAVGTGAGALKGAATGASVGTLFGPIGTAVGAGIGSIAGGVMGGVNSSRNAIEKANVEALRELERRRELGLLGLTEEEKLALYNEQDSAVNARANQLEATRRQYLAASQGLGAGQLYKQAQETEDALRKDRADINRNLQQQDLEEARREEAEYWTRLNALSQDQEQKRAENTVAVNEALSNLESLGSLSEILRTSDVLDSSGNPLAGGTINSFASENGVAPEELYNLLTLYAKRGQ